MSILHQNSKEVQVTRSHHDWLMRCTVRSAEYMPLDCDAKTIAGIDDDSGGRAAIAESPNHRNLNNQMNPATIEGQLDSWLQYPDGDLSQHSLSQG